ncbi:MAG: MarR family transcriptional regulator [Thermomicrobiales bacterium]
MTNLDTDDLAQRLLALTPRYVQWSAAALRDNRQEGDPSFRQLVVLYLVREGVASPIAIAQRLGITRAVVTGLLDRLEERGLIQRAPDPHDRRRLRIVLTDAGLAASERLGRTVTAQFAAQLATADAAELAALATALPLLERSVEALLDQTPPPDAVSVPDPWDDESTSPAPALARAR